MSQTVLPRGAGQGFDPWLREPGDERRSGAIQAEPFDAFDVRLAGLAVYQLGNN